MTDSRLARLRRVLLAALNTQYYRPWLEAASLGTAGQIGVLCSIAEGLRRLPRLEASVFLADPKQFLNSQAPRQGPTVFHYPHDLRPRTAVLMEGFRAARGVRVFPNGLGSKLEQFRAEALAGPLEKLRRLGKAVEAGEISLPPLARSVIVFTRIGQPCLGEEDRETLWRVFRVPVFEQVLSFANELLAWECEAHDALHIRDEAGFFEVHEKAGRPELLLTSLTDLSFPVLRLATGLNATVVTGLCGCGEPGDRLAWSRSEPLPMERVAACAA